MKTRIFSVQIFIFVFFMLGKMFAADSLNVKRVAAFLSHYDVTNMVDKIGNYVYTGVADSDLIVATDFSDIQNPSEVYRDTLRATDLEKFLSSNTIGYLAAGWNGLYVLDITNPDAPNIVGHVETNGYAERMAKINDFIVLDDRDEVLFIDVKNPSDPQIYTSLGSSISGDLVVIGTTLYIADADHGLYAYNISNLDSIYNIGKITSYNGSSYQPRALAIVGDSAFVIDYDYNRYESFLKVIDISNPEAMTVLTEYELEDHIANHDYIAPSEIIIEDNYAYLGDNTNGIVILDIQDIQNINQVGYYSFYEVNDDGGVVTSIGLQKFDVENGYIFTAWKKNSSSTYHRGTGYVLVNTLVVTSTRETNIVVPGKHRLSQNYPNPFNPQTRISYFLDNSRDEYNVKLEVFNISGQKIATLVNGKQHAGSYSIPFHGDGFPSGIYFYRLTVNNLLIQSKKMILIR